VNLHSILYAILISSVQIWIMLTRKHTRMLGPFNNYVTLSVFFNPFPLCHSLSCLNTPSENYVTVAQPFCKMSAGLQGFSDRYYL